ncbi:AAA family ATPase [Candidatus Falkowbacteria bacterium CG10_big_fil_rev_8_21_14_0_10_43_10]|uniref:AAA family ATPase n=1 Tax=Candidatus Falkowbacteria bacterium CG10_big_fil_rev_8_21_14_0_10_43_10 TaxID=1974567 RepID=A0A2H0V1E9_9BACT|nr:MAG: AAA family ATPase [Candidatus Falkowbacteria bacterium CG10_big_fil_rev_8_21_14_0_10_43_10]
MPRTNIIQHNAPLADRMRPKTLNDFVGQENIIGSGKILRQAIKGDNVPSIIFWGPPGCGKTTLARIIAGATNSEFLQLSAVMSGVKDIRAAVAKAKDLQAVNKRTILFIDEIHRFNKSQQDSLLPYVENGTITLIGATTENPSFEVISALLSRCRVFILEKLTAEHIKALAERALNSVPELKNVKIEDEALQFLCEMSDGDARVALNALEFASRTARTRTDLNADKHESRIIINRGRIEDALQKSLMYDKAGEEHYNIISALHKSMRGSDADAALYYLARMLEGGEDPLYIARRLIRFASEDIGIANSYALEQAVAAYNACHYIGMPECSVNLAQAVVYMAKSKKSNELYAAYGKAQADVKQYGALPVPLHIRNAPTKLMKELNYGKGYKYSPEYGYKEKQEYLPPQIKNHRYLT